MCKVIAILNQPTPDCLGFYPIVLKSRNGGLMLCGFPGGIQYLPTNRFEEGESLGLIFRVDGPALTEYTKYSYGAGWLGADFEKKRQRLGTPQVLMDKPVFVTETGRYWIQDKNRICAAINHWVEKSARIAISTHSRELTELMELVSPDHIDTRAALLVTRLDKKENQADLEWFAQLEREAGRPFALAVLEQQQRNSKTKILI